MASLLTGELEIGVRLVAVIRDPMAKVFAGVCPLRIEFVQKFLCRVRLLDLLFVWCRSHLLISQLTCDSSTVLTFKPYTSMQRGRSSIWETTTVFPFPMATKVVKTPS